MDDSTHTPMTFSISLAAGLLANAVFWAAGAGAAQHASPVPKPPTTSLCAALQSVDRGQELPIVVSGIFAVGRESQFLWDPRQPACEEDVQPSTSVGHKLADAVAQGSPMSPNSLQAHVGRKASH